MYTKCFSIFLIFINKLVIDVYTLPISDNQCATKANGAGICVSPANCEVLTTNTMKIEMVNKCKTRGLICCPTLTKLDNRIESNKIVPQIVHGVSVERNQYPFMVALGRTGPNDSENIDWVCGGSIISKNLILTAAHCLPITNIMIGTNNLIGVIASQTIIRPINETNIIHEDFKDGDQPQNDIAIIKLEADLEFNENVNSITLASDNHILPDIATAIGFGAKFPYGNAPSKVLMQVELQEVPCPKYYSITNQICYFDKRGKTVNGITLKSSTCRGDSGGPLFVKNTDNGQFIQIGIISFSYHNCVKEPTVFTSIPVFYEWIISQGY